MKTSTKKPIEYGATAAGTAIAASSPDAIYIRDRNLVDELMGKVDFTSMIVFQMRGRMPQEPERKMIDAILVMLMEHGLTPSSISARLIYDSSPDALQGAVAGGLLAAGSVFLGAMEQMGSLLQQGVTAIKAGETDAERYSRTVIGGLLERGAPVPGFGHHIHRPDDPRTPRLLALATEQGLAGAHTDLLLSFGRAMDSIKSRHVTINATGAVAAVLSDLGYPPPIMRGFSLIARAAGLVGHLLEEQQEPLAREMWDLLEHSVPYQGSALEMPDDTNESGVR
jgi:citrate synthase